MSDGIPARAAAQVILSDVLRKHRTLDGALEQLGHLEPRDAGFARAIASETLRRLGQIEALIRHFVPKSPPPHKAGPTLEILYAGACELLFLNVAPHAAVDAANRLAQADAKAVHFKSLVNAVLRRVARDGPAVLAEQDAARLNTPDWMWTRWCGTYGEETARAIAMAHAAPAATDLVLKDATFAGRLGGMPLIGNVVRLPASSRIEELPGFTAGHWWVQDIASSLPTRLFGDVAGQTVIDLCAAPGGKTMQLAARGANVIAVEREPDRLERLAENLKRTGLAATLVQGDARDFVPESPAPFVLLDAPCTATGTIRRHPDLPWLKSASDVTFCTQTAAELLAAAAKMVAPGGLLAFAVCSLEREECVEQIEDFLRLHHEFAREPIGEADVLGHAQWLSAEGDLRTLPCYLQEIGGMDGFFAALLRRL